MIKVSVVIPIYNVKNYIDRQIKSIIAQTITEWELILVDDCSTDDVRDILESYVKADSRIKVVYHERNLGAAMARATGLNCAVGEYVCFFDADDWVEPETLEEVYNLIKENNAQVGCFARYEEYDNCSKRIPFKDKGVVIYTGEEALGEMHCCKNIRSSTWNKMYERTLLEDSMFAKNKMVAEDYGMMIRLFEKASVVVQTDKPYYHYCFRKGSALNTGYSDFYKNGFYNYKEYEPYLLEKYPQYGKDIKRYHLIEQMAIVVSMFKNDLYDHEIRKEVTKNVRKHLHLLLFGKDVDIKFKAGAVALCIHYKILRAGYRLLNKKNIS